MGKRCVTPLSEAVDRRLYIAGLTRTDLAQQLGIAYSHVCLIMQGRMLPTIDIANKMAEILEMNPRKLRELALKKVV